MSKYQFILDKIYANFTNNALSWNDAESLMKIPSSEDIDWDKFFTKIAQYRWNKLNHPKQIKLYNPGQKFPALSLTGVHCDLACEHCDKKYLKGMRDVSDKSHFQEILSSLVAENINGALLSGGCQKDGSVPIVNFASEIQQFKEQHHFYLNSHLGIVDKPTIQKITHTGVDLVSFDLILDPDVITNVFHSPNTVENYKETYLNLRASSIRVVPHVLIGANFGNLSTELETIKYIHDHPVDMLVFIVMIPPKKAGKYDDRFNFIQANEVARLIFLAKALIPEMEISLGCMRLRNPEFRPMEKWGIQVGLDRIEIPGKSTLEWLHAKKFHISYFNACCAISHQFEEELTKKKNK